MGYLDYSPDTNPRWLYAIQCGQFIKIGVTTNLAKRLHDMRLLNPYPVKVIIRRRIHAAFHCERKMHEIFSDKAIGREWFEVTPEEALAALPDGMAHAREIRALAIAHNKRLRKISTQQTQAGTGTEENVARTEASGY